MEPLAEAIRSRYQFEGIKIVEQEHKIGLYADNIILTLSDPLISLLQSFSNISLFKINSTKSQMLSIHLTPEDKALSLTITAPYSARLRINVKTV